MLHTFDGKRSLSQPIYYFKSQTGNIATNDVVLTKLLVGTLKGLAFDWFLKLSPGSIKTFSDLESLFLMRFFDNDLEVSMPVLLTIKQRKDKPVKAFIERFQGIALKCLGGMT